MFEWNMKERLDALDSEITVLHRMLRHVLIQNEAILAKLEQRPSKLSPADQEKLNAIFATATGDIAKIDSVLPPKL